MVKLTLVLRGNRFLDWTYCCGGIRIPPQLHQWHGLLDLQKDRRRNPYLPQQYVQSRNQFPQRTRVNLTTNRTAPRQTHNTTRVFPPSVRVPLRQFDPARRVLEATIPELHQHLVVLSLRLTPQRRGSSMLFLRIRPSLRRSHLRMETVITRSSPSWRGLLQVARWCLSTTPQVRRSRVQVEIIRVLVLSITGGALAIVTRGRSVCPSGSILRLVSGRVTII